MPWAGAVKLPRDSRKVAAARRRLTINVFNVVAEGNEEKYTEFRAFHEDDSSFYIPRVYASQLGLSVRYAAGRDMPSGTMRPVKLLKHQVPWVDEIVALAEDRVHDVRAEAHTGSGKTVMSLEIARRRNKHTLIVVDQDFLRDQWVENAMKFFGVAREDIGFIQGDAFEFTRPIVIAMVQTLYRKALPANMLKRIGTVVFDESHGIGAPVYSKVLSMLPASFRLAVSATPDRGDELDKVLAWHLGPVQVHLAKEHKKSVVRIVEYGGCYSWYANTSPKTGRYLQELVADGDRNKLLANIIYRLWEKGRDILAISARIEQLESLIALCVLLGIPRDQMGLVSGYRTEWRLSKDDNPQRKPVGYVPKTLYTPLKMQLTRKRQNKKALDSAKNDSKIVFATEGMFRKGVDVPRLSAGVDCTPASKVQQLHGRVLRSAEGKVVPVWVTLRERRSQRAEYQLWARLSDYQKSNAEVYLWNMEKGVSLQNLPQLKKRVQNNSNTLRGCKIVTKRDGNYTVQT